MILFPHAQHIAPGGLLSRQQNLFQGDLESVKRSEADTHSDGALDPVHGEPFVKAMTQPLLPVHSEEGAHDGLVMVAIASDCGGLHASPHNVQGIR